MKDVVHFELVFIEARHALSKRASHGSASDLMVYCVFIFEEVFHESQFCPLHDEMSERHELPVSFQENVFYHAQCVSVRYAGV